MTVGRGGVPVKKYQRDYYYDCEPGRGRAGRLLQTRLSFVKMTPKNPETDDATVLNTSTVGQDGDSTNLE